MAGGIPISTALSSDAYTDITGAQAYFDGCLNTGSWDDASDIEKNKALLQATRAIDRLNFSGLRTADFTARMSSFSLDGNLVSTSILQPTSDIQPLEFPRNGATTIPQDIVAACCECALSFLDGIEVDQEIRSRNVISQRFGAVWENYDPKIINTALQNGIPSVTAWNYLLPYLQDPYELTIRRV